MLHFKLDFLGLFKIIINFKFMSKFRIKWIVYSLCSFNLKNEIYRIDRQTYITYKKPKRFGGGGVGKSFENLNTKIENRPGVSHFSLSEYTYDILSLFCLYSNLTSYSCKNPKFPYFPTILFFMAVSLSQENINIERNEVQKSVFVSLVGFINEKT